MDENLHPIDDLFKKAIDDHAEVPSSKVWEDIDKNLDKKKVISITRKYEKWKWVAAVFFIFSVGMAMYTLNLKLRYKEVVKSNKVRTTNTHNQKQITTDERNSAVNKSLTAKDEKKSSSANKLQKSPTASEPVTLKNKNAIVKVEKNNKPASNSNIHSRLTGNNILGANKQIQKEDVYAKSKGEQIKAPLVKVDIIKSSKPVKDVLSISKSIDYKENISTAVDSLYDASLFTEKYDVEASVVGLPKNLPVPPQVISSKDLSSISTVDNNLSKRANASRILKGLKPAKNTVSVFFSSGVVSTRLKNDRQHFREDDRHEIKENENSNNTYAIGLLVEHNIANNFSIFSGVSLATRVTDNNSKNLFARPDDRGNVSYRISSSAGYAYVTSKRPAGPGGGGGNRPSPGDSIRALSTTTTLQYLSVPAGLRYHINAGKFSFNPAVALAGNFITKKKIETVLFAAGGNESSTTSDIQGLKPAYFDGSIRTDIAYNLSRIIGISLVPSARFSLSSITKNGPVKTYVNTFGLGLGLNVHF